MALSKVPDLTHTYRGQDYTFVDQLDDYLKELECPICQSIVSEPLQTSCGHLFCTECYKKLQMAQCPVCRQVPDTMQDNRTNRIVKNLKVRCMNYQYGCKWVGNLGDELQHRETQGACHSEEIPCRYRCGTTIRRMTQEHHLKECPRRPHKCKYCNTVGLYRYIVGDHRKHCLKYPVRCPNGCDARIPREQTVGFMLNKEISTLKAKLQAEEQYIRDLEEDNEAKAECICQLERDIKAKTKYTHSLERDTGGLLQHMREVERDNEAMTKHIHQHKKDIKAMAEQVCDLRRDTAAKRKRILDLKLDTEVKEESIHRLEREVTAMAQHINDLEMKARDTVQQLCQLQEDTKAKAECIHDNDRATKAKTRYIRYLERSTKSKTQHITQLTAENSEKQRKLKCTKKFIVLALGSIVFFHLNPLYFLPLVIILLTVVYA